MTKTKVPPAVLSMVADQTAETLKTMEQLLPKLTEPGGFTERHQAYEAMKNTAQQNGARFGKLLGGGESMLHLGVKVSSAEGGLALIRAWIAKARGMVDAQS